MGGSSARHIRRSRISGGSCSRSRRVSHAARQAGARIGTMRYPLSVIDTEERKSSRDARTLVDAPACATTRSDDATGENGTPPNRIARTNRKAEGEALTASLGHMRWYHAKAGWTPGGRTHSVSRDGVAPAVKVRRRTRSASRGASAHPGETGGAAIVRAAARGAEASKGGRPASVLSIEEAIT